MTVLEATNKLVEFFATNDHLEMDLDFKKIILISDTDADKAAILIALEELAKNNFVVKKDINGKEYWVLYKPLTLQMHELQLNLVTALEVANIINKFIDKEEDKVSPFRVSEQDILNLCELAKRA